MSILSTISGALHLYGKSINSNAFTNVTFEFKSTPTDLPETPTWVVTIKLVGTMYTGFLTAPEPGPTEEIPQKTFEDVFRQEFSGKADSEELALKAAYEQIKGQIELFLKIREEETAFAQQAMLTVSSDDQAGLSSLWGSSESPLEGQVGGP